MPFFKAQAAQRKISALEIFRQIDQYPDQGHRNTHSLLLLLLLTMEPHTWIPGSMTIIVIRYPDSARAYTEFSAQRSAPTYHVRSASFTLRQCKADPFNN